jgi:choline dehydrogenase-like flavoprotein
MTLSSSVDVLVVGSGPAGVSVTFPLVEAGVRTLMVDGGQASSEPLLERPFLIERADNSQQWKWMIGEDFHALRRFDAISPKFKVPRHGYVFRDFPERNRIESERTLAVGSLARGGLSNAWGGGVARLSASELSAFPFPVADILPSYERVARRIGLSGNYPDDMAEYFGVDDWADPALPLDALNQQLFTRYAAQRRKSANFRLGRSRVAVLTRDSGERKSCALTGNCLWGCSNNALYSAAVEVNALQRFPTFEYRAGHIVESIRTEGSLIVAEGVGPNGPWSVRAHRLALAAGTLATTRLAAQAIGHRSPVKLQSSPTAAFMLWLPRMMGSELRSGFGLGQLSYALALADVTAFGSTFSLAGIPVAEVVRHLPFGTRYGTDLFRHLLGSCLVGNVFLPGHYSDLTAQLDASGYLRLTGEHSPLMLETMSRVAPSLGRAFRQLGAFLLPGSFSIAPPGSDVHYACTLPMRGSAGLGETTPYGELAGFPRLYVVDGACLSMLGEKSHTLTIMANADRIGKKMAGDVLRGREISCSASIRP